MIRRAYSKLREELFEVIIDWNLGNTCNFKCGYCHPHFHDGNNPFPSLARAKAFVDRIADKHQGSNRAVRFSFVGGEPTAWSDLLELCQHIKGHGFSSEIKTNGSMSLDAWEAFSDALSFATITYHETKLDYDHLVQVNILLQAKHIDTYTIFATLPDHFESVITKLNDYRRRFPQAMTEMQLLYADHMRRSELYPYSAEHLEQWRATIPVLELQDFVFEREDGSAETFPMPDDVILQKRNVFTGMACNIGADQIVIDQDGTIRRGWCRVGGILGNLNSDDFIKPEDGVVCTRATCNNPLDLSVLKHRGE